MITRNQLKNLSKEELFDLILQVDPSEIKFVCQSKNIRVKEICNSEEFKKAYYSSRKDISDLSTEELKEITKGKTILTFSGCYCPAHKGHYQIVEKVVKAVKPDIVLIITTNRQTNSRHGVPLDFTIKTWKDWGKILSKKYGVDMYIQWIYADSDHLLNWGRTSSNVKKIIKAKIYEDEKIPEEYIENPLQKMDTTGLSAGYFSGVPRDGRFYEYHVERTGDLSATKFVACLKDVNKDCLKYVPEDVKDKKDYIQEIRDTYADELK